MKSMCANRTLSLSGRSSGYTLQGLLIFLVTLVLLILLLANLFSSLYTTRSYLVQQLESHAQDAATSLGLSVSSVASTDDWVAASSMLDAMYDSGYYRRITLKDIRGKVITQRVSEAQVQDVPDWLVKRLTLATPEGVAQLVDGWKQLGQVEVESHPGFAYRKLWDELKSGLLVFAVVLALSFAVLHWVLRLILQPLRRLEMQADAIADNDFSHALPLPSSRELRRVTHAMNSMTEKLRHVFDEHVMLIEQLRARSSLDALTGLGNREDFDQRMHAELASEDSAAVGTLMLLQVKGFAHFNQERGREQGDELLISVADAIKTVAHECSGAFTSRRTGTDFMLYLPGVVGSLAASRTESLLSRIRPLSADARLAFHIGITEVSPGSELPELLAEADFALRQAQAQSEAGWASYKRSTAAISDESVRSAADWQRFLQDVLQQGSVQLFAQPLQAAQSPETPTAMPVCKVLSRVADGDHLVPAQDFIPMLLHWQLAANFDRLVIDQVVRYLESQSTAMSLSLSLASQTLDDADFLIWLETLCQQHSAVVGKITFEVSEQSLVDLESRVRALIGLSKDYGFAVAIDRFGSASVPFTYLQRLNLAYIKIDYRFVKGLSQHADNQFFIRSVIQMSHNQGIRVYALGVEKAEDWEILQSLGVDGAMGYYWGQPEAMALPE